MSFVVTVPKNCDRHLHADRHRRHRARSERSRLTITAADGAIAVTGADFPFLMVWTAGGALLLGVALLLVLTVVRRQRAASAR